MSWRTVIIGSQSKLDYRMGYLVIRKPDVQKQTQKILIDEIRTLVLENPAVSITGYLLSQLIEKKVKVIFSDTKRSPTAELVPYYGSCDSPAKIRRQMTWTEETKGEVWKAIVSEKIRNQARFLFELDKDEEGKLLSSYVRQVEPMDKTNREGHAAKVYFNAVFGMDFLRGADDPINSALNYGYSLLLSSFNREIAASGYLTQLALFHCNTV